MRNLVPLQLRQFKTLLGDSRINFNRLFLKTPRLVTVQRLRSGLFHSITADGKTEFLKRLFLVGNRVILSVIVVKFYLF